MADSRQASRPAPMPMTQFARGRRAKLLYWIGRALDRLSGGRVRLHVYLLCAQPVAAEASAALATNEVTRVRRVLPGDALLADFPRPAPVNALRFQQGAECHVVTVREQFAGHIWLARDVYAEDEVRCDFVLPADGASVWDFDVYVAPSFRLGRTAAKLWNHVSGQLSAQGVRRTFSRIALFNIGSVQNHERLGALRVGMCAFLVAGRLQAAFLPGWPFVHIGLASRPRIELKR